MADKWIQNAIQKPGSFTAQANKAGEGVQTYANEVLANKGEHTTKTVRRAALAKRLNAMNKG